MVTLLVTYSHSISSVAFIPLHDAVFHDCKRNDAAFFTRIVTFGLDHQLFFILNQVTPYLTLVTIMLYRYAEGSGASY